MRKSSPNKTRGRKQIVIRAKPNDAPSINRARAVLRPTVQAAFTLKEISRLYRGIELSGLVEALTEQTQSAGDRDLGRAEAMLTAQAHTLDAIFNCLARVAMNAERMDMLECYLKLALRAQSQSRAAWEAISVIQNPPIAGYVGQANIAAGPQQVNNQTAPRAGARTGENENQPNKLLERTTHEPEQWVDRRAPQAASAANPQMAAVGSVNGTEDAKGQG